MPLFKTFPRLITTRWQIANAIGTMGNTKFYPISCEYVTLVREFGHEENNIKFSEYVEKRQRLQIVEKKIDEWLDIISKIQKPFEDFSNNIHYRDFIKKDSRLYFFEMSCNEEIYNGVKLQLDEDQKYLVECYGLYIHKHSSGKLNVDMMLEGDEWRVRIVPIADSL